MPDADLSPPRMSRRAHVLILLALAMGGFAIGISEFSTMGLMTQIAQGLRISAPQVGHVISAYALGVWWSARRCWRSWTHAGRGVRCCCC